MDAIVATASKVFKSDRLVYRAFDDKDEELRAWFHDNIASDPVVDALATSSLPKPPTKKQTSDYIEGISGCILIVAVCLPVAPGDDKAKDSDDHAAKMDKPKNEIIGYVGLGGSPHMAHHRSASIVISLADKYQGRGYGGECINWIVDWGFRFANLHRIAIGAVSYNERALSLYQKLGFVIEGRQRERVFFDRKRYDLVDMSMLATEWEQLRKIRSTGTQD